MLSNHLIFCLPLLLLPSMSPCIRVFSNQSALCIKWPKYWSFSFSISPSNEYSGLNSFKFDWFDLLAAQGTLKSLLKYHNSKASILLMFNLLYGPILTSIHDYWKTIALTIQNFVSKIMFLFFNMLSSFVIPSPEYLPKPGIEPWSPALQTNSLPSIWATKEVQKHWSG